MDFKISESTSMPMCLIFPKVFSYDAMKPSRLQEHLNKIHTNKKNKDLSYFQGIEKQYFKQPIVLNLFASSSKQAKLENHS